MTYQERVIDVLKGIQMALDEWDHYSDEERAEWVRLVRPQIQDALDPTLSIEANPAIAKEMTSCTYCDNPRAGNSLLPHLCAEHVAFVRRPRGANAETHTTGLEQER